MFNHKLLREALLAATILLTFASVSSFAQASNATLSGTVTDEQNAPVAGATIQVINDATGLNRTITTDDDGNFVVPLLPPSTYRLTVERTGFAPFEAKNVILNVNDKKALSIKLKIGQVTGTVDVTNEPATVNESPSSSTVIDRNLIENIPMNGRSFQTLINLTPGVVNSEERGQFSVNGLRTSTNYFTVDGISGNFDAGGFNTSNMNGSTAATNATGGYSNLVPLEALQEFKITTSNASTEESRTAGAQVALTTKSGTNRFSGSLFEYFRNDALDANDWFFNKAGVKAPLRQNIYGGSFGGPIVLPRFGEGTPYVWKGKDKSFFFFTYEETRILLPTDIPCRNVPSLSFRSQQTNPDAERLARMFPEPNRANTCAGTVNVNVAGRAEGISNPTRGKSMSLKLDHNLTDKVSLFGYYVYSPSYSENVTFINNAIQTDSTSTFLTLGSTQAFSSKLINTFRINRATSMSEKSAVFNTKGGAIIPEVGWFIPSFTGLTFDDVYISPIQVNGLTGLVAGREIGDKQFQYNLNDNLSYVLGNHNLKFGVDYRRLTPKRDAARLTGTVNFRVSGTGSATLINFATTSQAYGFKTRSKLLFENYSFYGEDSWKVNKRLTLNYGLRWNINPAPESLTDQPLLTVLNPLNPAIAPAGTPLYETKFDNISPRIGFSYLLRNKDGWETVVRGGYSLVNDLGQGTLGLSVFPSLRTRLFTGYPFTPAQFSTLVQPDFTPSPTNQAQLIIADQNIKAPLISQYNLTVDQNLGRNQVLSLAYVGNAGRRLLRNVYYNNPSPSFTGLTVIQNGSTSDYNSFQASFQRRLTKGFQAQVAYTWAHAIDSGSSDVGVENIYDSNLDRANSAFDVRHSFNAALSYAVPMPKNMWKPARYVLDGWVIDGIVTARTARPLDVIAGTLFDKGTQNIYRPNLVAGQPLFITAADNKCQVPAGAGVTAQVVDCPGGKMLNPSAFTVRFDPARPDFYLQGALGRNTLRGFGARQIDMALRREFRFNETSKLSLRLEAFNVFNFVNFGDPNTTVFLSLPFSLQPNGFRDSTFGVSRSTLGRRLATAGNSFSPLFQVGGPRSLQLVARFNF